MGKVISIAIVCIVIFLAFLFWGGFRKIDTQKNEFKGPQGIPSVRGPFGPVPN